MDYAEFLKKMKKDKRNLSEAKSWDDFVIYMFSLHCSWAWPIHMIEM